MTSSCDKSMLVLCSKWPPKVGRFHPHLFFSFGEVTDYNKDTKRYYNYLILQIFTKLCCELLAKPKNDP